MNTTSKHREPIFAGIFYPDDAQFLDDLIAMAVQSAQPGRFGAKALLIPHACFDYIHGLQAIAWKSATGNRHPIDTIFILADTTHYDKPAIILPESDFFDTPIGSIRINQNSCAEILASSTIVHIDDIAHMKEHSIEVQLPFMKKLFPEASLVPILLAGKGDAIARIVSNILDILLLEGSTGRLMVSSSNIASSVLPQKASQLAAKMLENISRFNRDGLYRDTVDYAHVAVGSIAAVLGLSHLAGSEFCLLGQADSGILRDNNVESIVQYAAAGWY